MTPDSKMPLASGSPGLSQLKPAEPSAYAPERTEAPPRPRLSAGHLWLRRSLVLLFVFLCATIGVMLMILPWRPEWTENHLLAALPTVRDILATGFARGVCTGLGVVNVWIGFWEAIQYQEEERE
jgi:hypothetical protein